MTHDAAALDAVRQACIEAALAGYEDAGIAGLCAEGRWEAAISAMQALDVKQFAEANAGSTQKTQKDAEDAKKAA